MSIDPDKDWIALNRSLLLNELWRNDVFSRGQAWVDLLLVANWKEGRAIVKGVVIPLKRGQLCRSMKQLSIRWKWSIGKVKRFLDLCSDLEQITYETCNKNGTQNGTQKNAITTLITITNYERYQARGTVNGTQTERKRNADGTQTETEEEGKKERRKEKKKHNDFVLPEWVPVEEWEAYVDMRRSIRKPMTDYAKHLAVKDLEKLCKDGADPSAIIQQSIKNSWQGLFEVKADKKEAPGNSRQQIRGKDGLVW